ncbi:MAG: 4Fe-4S dicluster domain-containing protein [Thermoplasmata archaeon]|nr:4Fe-4S dicluster domain-containing protein [Thermoplasmata archaeon]
MCANLTYYFSVTMGSKTFRATSFRTAKLYQSQPAWMDVKTISRISVRAVKPFFNTRYRLASWTRRSKTFNRIVRRVMFEGDDMVVIPKDTVVRRTINTDISVDEPGDSTVLPSDVVKSLICRTDDIFIMNFCLCRRSNECENYDVGHGCVFLGKGVHKIPEEYGHLATKEEAVSYIDECGDLGLVHIIGRNKLDSLWLQTGDKKDLMTICNCCPCCCLWNMTRNISDEIGSKFKRMEGVTVSLDQDRCIGCGSCSEICFCKAARIEEGRFSIDQDICRGCGRCVEECPSEAITITYDDSAIDGIVERIGSLVNLS